MDILLVARDTIFNNMVRKKTNSQWGHSSVVIDGIVYDFDLNGRSKKSLSDIVSEPNVSKATLFYIDMPRGDWEAEEMYRALFSVSDYDITSLYNLRNRLPNGRDSENIQTRLGLYTCSNMIAKVCSENYKEGSTPEFLNDIHWSQTIPDDYSKLEHRTELILPKHL